MTDFENFLKIKTYSTPLNDHLDIRLKGLLTQAVKENKIYLNHAAITAGPK